MIALITRLLWVDNAFIRGLLLFGIIARQIGLLAGCKQSICADAAGGLLNFEVSYCKGLPLHMGSFLGPLSLFVIIVIQIRISFLVPRCIKLLAGARRFPKNLFVHRAPQCPVVPLVFSPFVFFFR